MCVQVCVQMDGQCSKERPLVSNPKKARVDSLVSVFFVCLLQTARAEFVSAVEWSVQLALKTTKRVIFAGLFQETGGSTGPDGFDPRSLLGKRAGLGWRFATFSLRHLQSEQYTDG